MAGRDSRPCRPFPSLLDLNREAVGAKIDGGNRRRKRVDNSELEIQQGTIAIDGVVAPKTIWTVPAPPGDVCSVAGGPPGYKASGPNCPRAAR